jgi:hypothetical protein
MNEFTQLRIEARRVRNDAIARARAQYDRTLEALADLQAQQNGERRRAAPFTMERGIPTDGTRSVDISFDFPILRTHVGHRL